MTDSVNYSNSADHRGPAKPSRVVILSTADFNAPVWTNKQHLAVGLAEWTDVTYIESMGLRRPSFTIVDVFRIIARGKGLLTKYKEPIRSNDETGSPKETLLPRVLTPVILPFHGSRLARWVNQRLVNRILLPKIGLREPFILWTFSPITYNLEKFATKTVYHSVDLLHELPGVPKEAMVRAETSLVEVADQVVVSSEGVKSHIEGLGRRPDTIWENVASVELFSATRRSRYPRAIFAGNLTPTKVDSKLVLGIAAAGIDVVLAGPKSIDGVDSDEPFQELFSHPRISYLGNLSLEELAHAASESMVGLIPYYLNAYTQGVFPMKVYEYLSAGLEVISTPLPSLVGKDIPGLSNAAGETFVADAVRAVQMFSEEEATLRSKRAANNSWTNRNRQVRSLITTLCESGGHGD